MLTSKERVFIQLQVVVITSAPSFKKRKRGRRLTKKASFTAVFTLMRAQEGGWGWGERVVRTG